MRGIKGFYHKANRERSGEQDIDAKFEVAKIKIDVLKSDIIAKEKD